MPPRLALGPLLQEKPAGEFAALWRAELESAAGLELVELAPALADAMAVKDETERACLKRAAIFSAVVMQKHVVQKLEAARRARWHEWAAASLQPAVWSRPKPRPGRVSRCCRTQI